MPFTIDPKRDRAWLRRAMAQSGEPPKPRRKPAPTLGLLGRRILALTPEGRVEVERLVARLLAEEEASE